MENSQINWSNYSIRDYAMSSNSVMGLLEQTLKNDGYIYDYQDEDDPSASPKPYLEGFKIVEQETCGGEGEGEVYWAVWSITYPDDHTEFWRASLTYYSYDGVQWDGWFRNFEKVEIKQVSRSEWGAV